MPISKRDRGKRVERWNSMHAKVTSLCETRPELAEALARAALVVLFYDSDCVPLDEHDSVDGADVIDALNEALGLDLDEVRRLLS